MPCESITESAGWLDARATIALMAFGLSVLSLGTSIVLQNANRNRQEVRDHFDADIRDVVNEALKDLRAQRVKVVQKIDEALTKATHAQAAVELDKIRDQEIGPTLYELQQSVLDADKEYGHRLGKYEVLLPGMKLAKWPQSEAFRDEIDDRYDELMEALSDLGVELQAESQSIDTARFSAAVYSFINELRSFLNEIRSVISTKKYRRSINR